MRVACFLILSIALMSGCMGGLGSNVTQEQNETARIVAQQKAATPAGTTVTNAEGGTVMVNQGDEAIRAAKATKEGSVNGNASEDFLGKFKNPFTLLLIGIGVLVCLFALVKVIDWVKSTGIYKTAAVATAPIVEQIKRAVADRAKASDAVTMAQCDAEIARLNGLKADIEKKLHS